MKPKLPWMPVVVDDWLTSPTRLKMTHKERAVYLELMMFQWRDGSITSDSSVLAKLVTMDDQEFSSVAPVVLSCFNLRRGRYRNAKLGLLRTSAQKRKRTAELRGHEGGQAKAKKDRELRGLSMTRASYDSVTVSSSEILESRKSEKPPPRAGSENGSFDPGPGWAQVEALCGQQPIAPKIRKPDLACQVYLSVCDGAERLSAILDGIRRYKASDEVQRGIVVSLENFLADRMWGGTWRPAEVETSKTVSARKAVKDWKPE